MRSIKEMVRDNQVVRFSHYREGQLWYATECGFLFPVPISDIGDATFQAQERAMLFMRYIRPHHEMLTQARAAEEAV